jgi:hypothetical protein
MDFGGSMYPLRTVSFSHLQRLGQILWNWQLCGGCTAKSSCAGPICPWSRAKSLSRFWDLYKDMTAAYVPDFIGQQPALTSHDELLGLMMKIKGRPDMAREELVREVFHTGGADTSNLVLSTDQECAFKMGASLLFLMGSGTSPGPEDILEDLTPPFPWRDCMSVKGFISEAFPQGGSSLLGSKGDAVRIQNVAAALTAFKITKNTGLRFRATNDLRAHLTLDEKGVVRIFHCTAVLKELLLATLEDPGACIIPRSLVLEVLDTIHNILFPSDRASQALLSNLVSKHGFDADILRYESAAYRSKDDADVTYCYFGVRLVELYDELQTPTPRTRLESWFERKSGARHVMMATMIGVFIAVIIGILGLGISGFQAYVSYQQWKHPVKDA